MLQRALGASFYSNDAHPPTLKEKSDLLVLFYPLLPSAIVGLFLVSCSLSRLFPKSKIINEGCGLFPDENPEDSQWESNASKERFLMWL